MPMSIAAWQKLLKCQEDVNKHSKRLNDLEKELEQLKEQAKPKRGRPKSTNVEASES